jgi:hypothetical protein
MDSALRSRRGASRCRHRRMALAFLAGWLGEAYVGEHAWTAEGRIRAVGGRKLRPELRLAASMFDATPTRADLV